MTITPQTSELNVALIDLETQLQRKVEMDDLTQVHQWAEAVRTSFDRLDAIVDRKRQKIHARLFEEIAEQDESRRKQIQELQEADRCVDQLLEVVKSQLIVLSMQSASEVEPRIEVAADEPVLNVIDRGTELIHWIREQEESVTSWFAEAFAEGAV